MDNIQKNVDLLISLINELKENINCREHTALSHELLKAIHCLKSHDLIGLDIIINSVKKDNLFQDNTDENLINLKEQILQLSKEIKIDYAKDEIPITKAEELFLNLSYNKYFDILSEVYTKEFWEKEPYYRLSRFTQVLSIYNEIINHEPFQGVFNWLKKNRPPMEAEICNSLFKFIRNVLIHFPYFDCWNEIWINKEIINWYRPNQSIDKFLKNYCGKSKVEYRFKENNLSGFTYVTICFPKCYDNEKIYLKDIIKEEEGIKFIVLMMLRVLNTQIISVTN